MVFLIEDFIVCKYRYSQPEFTVLNAKSPLVKYVGGPSTCSHFCEFLIYPKFSALSQQALFTSDVFGNAYIHGSYGHVRSYTVALELDIRRCLESATKRKVLRVVLKAYRTADPIACTDPEISTCEIPPRLRNKLQVCYPAQIKKTIRPVVVSND